jgi:hypothetical protein
MTTIKSSALDFQNIKTSLTSYLQAKPEFTDYKFDASGINNLLDVLAYNTHINGLTANMALNESFMSSAQLRSSVVSHAEMLGYYPRSRTGSSATVSISAATSDTTTATATLPKNSKFSVNIDDVSYTFQTLEQYTASNNGSGTFAFKTTADSTELTIKEGIQKTKTFIVGETSDQQVYVIPDTTIDTSTIVVDIFDTTTSSTSTPYTNINDNVRITEASTVYIVRETPNGGFELIFSDGNVLGKSPVAGNKIVVTYLSTKGSVANGGTTFIPSQKVTIGGTAYDLTVTTVANSANGAEKESLASIKLNAPVSFATQQRLVTAEDYKAIILQRYSNSIEDVIAWGGNDNVPPEFGKVYVSLKFKSGITADSQTLVKDAIKTTVSENLAIMSIDTEFTDPLDTFMEFAITFNFDPDLTGSTLESTQTTILSDVDSFFTDNLNKFGQIFRRSTLTARIDDLDPAILNSAMVVKIQRRFTPTLNVLQNNEVVFPVVIASPDDVNRIVTTTNMTVDSKTCRIQNVLSSNKLELVDINTLNIVKDNVGSYDAGSGKVSITGLNVSAFVGDAIKVTVVPADTGTVRPLRNHILKLDTAKTSAIGTIDNQNTKTILS